MSQHKKQQTKDRWASTSKKTATTYTLELLESRILLSGDLAGAVQAVPVNQVEVPQQAVVHVQSAPSSSQQTFSVSEILAKPVASFHLRSDEASQAASHRNESPPGQVGASSHLSSQDTRTVSEILGQEEQIQTQTQTQSISTPVTNTLQSQTTLAPTVQQQTLTHAQILALQTQQPIAQAPTQLTDAEILALQTQQPITQVPTQLTDAQVLALQTQQPISQPLQDQTQPVSQGLVQVPLSPTTQTNTTINSITPTNGGINPELPRASVDTSMPTTSVTVRVGPHGDYTDLQTALNNVSLDTTILLQPGVSYTSPNDNGFILPNKATGTGWIVIRPDVADSALPAPGTRITPAQSALMPKIVRGDTNLYAMSVAPGAHNYRIIGVEFMNQGNVDTRYNGTFLNLDGRESSVSAQSNNIILDRAYVHGPSAPGALGVKFGIVLGGQYQAVIDSHIEDIVSPDGESKAIAMWNGAGPIKIQNNFLSAAGENMMIGGADPVVPDLVPSDIEIRHNHFFKPLEWKDPAYAAPSIGYKVGTKNLFELKNAQRVLVDDNAFENVWYPNNQSGFAIMITPRNQSGTAPWSVVQDLTFTNNKIIGAANGIAVSGFDSNWQVGMPSQHGGRMLFQNNLITNLGTDPSIDVHRGTGKFFLITNGVSDLHIINNTVASYAGTIGNDFTFTFGIQDEGALFPLQGLIIKYNVLQHAGNITFHAGAPLATVAPGAILS